VTVATGAILALAPGCYRDVRVNSGGTVNLSAGAYTFRTLRLIAGSTLNGAGQIVNVPSDTNSEGGVKINDVTIETPGSAGFSVKTFINIGNNNILNNVVLYVPTSGIHTHTGLQATNLEAVANFITLEPKDNPPGFVCECPPAPILGTALRGCACLTSVGGWLVA